MRITLRYVLPAILVALVGVTAASAWAYRLLDAAAEQRVAVEVLKLSYQFLVLVLLGLLVTTSLEAGRARRAAVRAERNRKELFVKALADLTHDVDLARLLIMANRSVLTWDTQMNQRIVPAYTRLRDLSHDAKTASAAREPIFTNSVDVLAGLERMQKYLKTVVGEFAEEKKDLSERQRAAEPDRTQQQHLWAAMIALPMLGDLVRDGEHYGTFREAYGDLLRSMRHDLVSRGASMRGVTTFTHQVTNV